MMEEEKEGMNKDRILEILEIAKDESGSVPISLVRKAFDKIQEPCEDTISRQDAMEAIMKYANTHAFNSYYSGMSRARDIVEKLPSVKPKNAR